jgi:hypothetical protein
VVLLFQLHHHPVNHQTPIYQDHMYVQEDGMGAIGQIRILIQVIQRFVIHGIRLNRVIMGQLLHRAMIIGNEHNLQQIRMFKILI